MTACEHSPASADNTCIRIVPIFQGLQETEILALHNVTRQKKYRKGEFIFRDGEDSHMLYVVNQGVVKISKLTESGKEQIIRFLFKGDFFGQFALLQNKKHYAHAEVLEASTVCQIHQQDFHAILKSNPDMAYRFLLAVSERLQQADEWISTISLLEVERRLARILLLFHSKSGVSQHILQLPVAKKELAHWLGTTPETISRKFSQLEEQGILALDSHNQIRILDMERLQQLSEHAANITL